MLENIHDKFFKKVFSNVENVRDFLYTSLPSDIQRDIDLDGITIDPTSYIADDIKDYFCDIVVKTKLKDSDSDADIYIIMEHKSYHDKAVLVQLLKYMLVMWEKDMAEKKPLRIIVPLVFYHGKRKWDIPLQFIEQFKVKDDLKKYLLNFQYILFDTNMQNFENNPILKNNVFLLTSLILLKSVFKKDFASIIKIFEFWEDRGFLENKEALLFFSTYIFETKDITPEKLEELLKESKLERSEIMPTLAQRLRKEGRQEGKQEGKKEKAIEIAKNLLDILDVKTISLKTGLSEKEIEDLKNGKNS